jgi:hypothetical protein
MDDTCPLRKRCYKKKPLKFTEIESFLDTSKNKIKINIVYYNSLLKEVFKNYVFSKKVSSECDILFTKLGNYYYIYNGILLNLEILWNSSKIKARLANHITIGYDRRSWNIHETTYSTNIKSNNLYYIVKKEQTIYYNISHKSQTLVQFVPENDSKKNSKLNIESIWNEILCGTGNKFGTKSGKKIAIKKKIKAQALKKIRPPSNFKVINSIKNLKLKKENIAIYRTDINKKIIFQNKVIKAAKNKNVLFIHNKNFTYIIINIHYEPIDIDEYLTENEKSIFN